MRVFILTFLFLGAQILCAQTNSVVPGWPAATQEAKPWTRWWWHGSAVTKRGITAELESFQKAGLGGVEITPIYGVEGHENSFVDFLSKEWVELLTHTLREAERLGLGVDMATGTGWPFGGPWVGEEEACRNFYYKTYSLKEGQSLLEKVSFTQSPYFRVIGNFIYETNEAAAAVRKEPFNSFAAGNIDVQKILSPIEENSDLQAYAFDQVQFRKDIPLQVLMAYSDTGEILDLTERVNDVGDLNWVAAAGDWELYAIFQGWHGKMVERAAPGGEGNVIDHFSEHAVQRYFARFDEAFRGQDIDGLRAFFNDSYEVDDAKGAADWTPNLFAEFQKRRGYDLRLQLPALLGHDTEQKNARVLSDYRETIGDLLREYFTTSWKTWAHGYNAVVRNQAHGSPANILDLYALVDIPEIEGVEPLRIKMASSSGNVTGKKLVSSESATWLNEHFESNLSDMKEALDRFMLNGVNHVFYHGTSWSPEGEPWPGWLFYAAVHLNARNPMWGDFHALNKYVERCQSFLQNTSADNDVLLYYPIYDAFAVRGPKNLAHFDGIEEQFSGTSFAAVAQMLHRKGYGFDYVSDAQIRNFSVADGRIISEGKSAYRLIVVPACRFMPVETLEKIYTLASEGATVVFVDELPVSFPGLSDYDKNMDRFEKLKALLRSRISDQDGVYVQSADQILPAGVVTRETISDTGLTFIRKKQGDGTKLYFTSNPGDSLFSGWVTFQTAGKDVFLYDPMTGEFGKGERREGNGTTHVYLQLEPAQSVFVQFLQAPHLGGNFFYADEGQPIDIKGEWHLQCISGGPRLPSPLHINTLRSWTLFKDSAYSDFSGTCAYRVTFDRPRSSSRVFWLDLGQVRETASVYLNNEYIGTVIGPVYRLKIDGGRLKRKNVLEVRVSNLMANRIAYMDRNGIYWKKFYNVNMSARKPENRRNGIFDASHWMPRESGLLGPVRLIPITDRF